MESENLLPFKAPTIRRATLNDVKSIARVHVDCWCEGYHNILSQSYLESLKYNDRALMWSRHLPRKDKKSATYVLTGHDGDVVGFCDFGPAREHEHGFKGEIYAIYILQKFQKQGWGKKFFFVVRSFFLKNKISSFYLWVLSENENRNFYLHMGGEYLKSQYIEIGGVNLKEDLIFFNLGK